MFTEQTCLFSKHLTTTHDLTLQLCAEMLIGFKITVRYFSPILTKIEIF
jgi:hypothetical protein